MNKPFTLMVVGELCMIEWHFSGNYSCMSHLKFRKNVNNLATLKRHSRL